eukprot:349969_1
MKIHILNICVGYFCIFSLIYLMYFSWKVMMPFIHIYMDLNINDSEAVFDVGKFNYHIYKTLKGFMFNFILFEWFIFMTLGVFYQMYWSLRVRAHVLCYYWTTISIYCTIMSFFHYIEMDKHWTCPKCGFHETIKHYNTTSICKICYGSDIRKQSSKFNIESVAEQDIKETDETEDNQDINAIEVSIDNNNSSTQVNEISQHINTQLFENGQLNIANQENCGANCPSFMRIRQLCDIFSTQTKNSFQQIFDELSDYSFRGLINDSVHLIKHHDVGKMNELIGECENVIVCNIVRSQSRHNGRKSLLIKEMEKIHCYLFHNIHRTDDTNSIQNSRKQKYLDECKEEVKVGYVPVNIAIDNENVNNMKQLADETKQEELSEKIESVLNEFENKEQEQKKEEILPTCICGDKLSKEHSNVYGENSTIWCDICKKSCVDDQFVYHCRKGQSMSQHPNGFDLCKNCGEIMKAQEEKYEEYRYNEYGFGSFIYYDLLKPKYQTFKQELLSNEMYAIDNDVWNDIFKKAKEYGK